MTNPTDKEAVLAANEAFYNAFTNRDLSAMNLLWWQGSTSICIHPGSSPILGWEDIRNSWQAIFQNTASLEIDIEIINVEVDQALAYVVLREVVLQSNQGRRMKATSLATNVYQKMAQKWYLVSHHGSPIMR
ncbi:MAG: nuclear transport factor 2 family protein [Cyanobacteria bacterium P01_G01_bin.39]